MDNVAFARQPDGSDVLDSLDEIITRHPFADCTYVTGQLHACFTRRLTKIANHLRPAAELLCALGTATPRQRYLVLGNTVVRSAVQHALRQLETGAEYGMPLAQCGGIFEIAAASLIRGEGGPLKQRSENRIGPAAWHGTVWQEDASEPAFTSALQYLVHDNYHALPHQPSAEEVSFVARGAALAELLVPGIARSAFSHVHSVVLFEPSGPWKNTASSSEFRLNGSVFLSTKFLSNPWWVAEHLLHEALHQQLYEIRHCHSLFSGEFDRDDAPRIRSLWNVPDGNLWDAHRGLAAFHVYVCLSLFSQLAERRADELSLEYGALKITASTKCLHRARYLSEQLSTTCRDELGQAGKRLVEYFTEVLDALDGSPPLPGSTIHLLLDRYRKEAREVEGVLAGDGADGELIHALDEIGRAEIETTRRVLGAINAQARLDEFNNALGALPDERPSATFAKLRGLVADIVVSSACDEFKLPAFQDQAISRMVEDSSQRLKAALGR
jgi:hypothetical protein